MQNWYISNKKKGNKKISIKIISSNKKRIDYTLTTKKKAA